MKTHLKSKKFLLSEKEKKQRNPTYRKVQRKNIIPALLIVTAVALLILSCVFMEDSNYEIIFIGVLLILGSFSSFLLAFIQIKCIKKYWVCPVCQKELPVSSIKTIPIPDYVEECPFCGSCLEEPVPQKETTGIPKLKYTLITLIGILVCLYGLFMTVFFCLYITEETLYQCLIDIAINLFAFILGLMMVFCKQKKHEEKENLVLSVKSTDSFLWMGLFLAVLGTVLLFFASCVLEINELGLCAFFVIFGGPSLALGVCKILTYRNSELCLYDDGSMGVIGSWGHYRQVDFTKITTLSLSLTRQGGVRINRKPHRKLIRFHLSFDDSEQLMDWLEEHNIDFQIRLMGAEKNISAENSDESEDLEEVDDLEEFSVSEPTLEWDEGEKTRWHGCLKAIRWGLVFICLISCAGSMAIFAAPSMGWKIIKTIKIMMFSPILLYLYWFIFCDVFVTEKPKNATKEWKKHYISFPIWLLALQVIWLLEHIDVLEHTVLTTVEFGRVCVTYGVVAVLLGIITIYRIPSKRRKAAEICGMIMMVLLISVPLNYGLQISLCKEKQHYPAQIIENKIQENEDDEDKQYLLTVCLDDGKKIEIEVTDKQYQNYQNGESFQVCQRENIFGVRMVDLHK